MKRVVRSGRVKFRPFGIILVAFLMLGGIAFMGARFGERPIVAADTPTGDVKSVIVKFRGVAPVSSTSAAEQQRAVINEADAKISNETPYSEGYKQKIRTYNNLPYAVYVVDAAGEASLKADPNVESVHDNQILKPAFDSPLVTIGGAANGDFTDVSGTYTGDGYAVAIIDTGVDKNHPALAGKVIAEACFGENQVYADAVVESLCPGGAVFSDEVGSGQDCTIAGCDHGTMVAGAAAEGEGYVDIDQDGTADQFSGVAKSAKIIAIKVAVKITSETLCPTAPDNICALPLESLYLAALDYVANTSFSVPIASVNLSIGSDDYYSTNATCAASPVARAFTAAAATLRAHRIVPVVANGNSGDPVAYESNIDKISAPACAEGAVAVGATNILGTEVASYSNNGPATTLLAPGGDYDEVNIDSLMWLPENGTGALEYAQGTSFAAPMVAGAYAVLREKHPDASIDSLTSLLQSSGVDVVDNRAGYTVGAKKRIDLGAALTQSPLPAISSFAGPVTDINQGAPIELTATVANATNCSINNGVGAVAINGGAISVSVPGKSSYTLSCKNAYNDQVSSTLDFTINVAPTTPVLRTETFNKEAGTFLLEWEASTDSHGIQEYQVFLNGQKVATLPATTLSYIFENLDDDVVYTAEVRAVDTLGAISTAAASTFGSGPIVGVPNTGLFSLQYLSGKSLIVAVLGAVAAVSIFVLARRHTR